MILLAADTSTQRRARPVLGTTKRNGEGTFVVTVFLASIYETFRLGSIQHALNPMEADQLAQAVERVLAHELVHALAPGQAHSERGLMRHSFARADLLSALNVGDAQAVRTLLAGTGQAATAPVGS